MLDELLPLLRTPTLHRPGLTVAGQHNVRRAPDGSLDTATLVGPGGDDPSVVVGGIWHAMGSGRRPRTLAQLSNVVPPTPQLYESVWRVRSLGLLSGRDFPIAEELGELDDALGDVEGAAVIDVGCSEGLYSRHLAHRGARPLAVDHSLPFLRRTRHRAQRARVGVAPIQAVAQQLPVLDGVLDGAVIGGTLNEIGDRSGALAELARVTKPGARVFVMSLGRASSRVGQMVQRGLGLAGIEFPDAQRTAVEWSAAGFEVMDQRVDGLVIRTILRRLT